MIEKEWVLAPQAPASYLCQNWDVHPILAQIMLNRGFKEPEGAQRFLYQNDLPEDPRDMKDMDKAVERISAAIAAHEPIVVYGDFDADGVSATALMTQVLTELGARVTAYFPDRFKEGYGLNTEALELLAEQGAKLVITVDCGIRSVNEVRAGRLFGLDMIVTDHHSIGPEIPAALAVINPQQADCPGSSSLAGVGVAFMLAKALLLHRWHKDRANYPHSLRLSDLLDLVALGTVADVVPLNDSLNRRLVKHGLQTINEMRRPGIQALAAVAKLESGPIKAPDIGFRLGPRINAAGRLKSARVAYNLLSAKTFSEAEPHAQELQRLNSWRQDLTRQVQAAVNAQIEGVENLSLIFEGDENFHAGVLGLVAGRVTEEHYRPTVILEMGDRESRASCRSIPEFHITQALDQCADLLVRHGGHAMAAGFTVNNRNMEVLREKLEQIVAESLDKQDLRPKLHLDQELQLDDLSEDLAYAVSALEPTGQKNPPAAFMSRNLNAVRCYRVGKDGAHLKLKFARNGKPPIDAISFGTGDRAAEFSRSVDAAYHLEMNEWNGNRSLQMQLLDIRPAAHA